MSMPEPGKKLYFIAIIPPSHIVEEALALQQYFRDRFKSKAALNSPPHITLHMPFELNEEQETIIVKKLQQFSATQRVFSLKLENFDCFRPRVIFVRVVKEPELDNLQKQLRRFCLNLSFFKAQDKELPYRPHLTLAFRDLKKSMFHKAWDELQSKQFHAEFKVDRIVLLKHNGQLWDVFRAFLLA